MLAGVEGSRLIILYWSFAIWTVFPCSHPTHTKRAHQRAWSEGENEGRKSQRSNGGPVQIEAKSCDYGDDGYHKDRLPNCGIEQAGTQSARFGLQHLVFHIDLHKCL
jgi:hypothetical protein